MDELLVLNLVFSRRLIFIFKLLSYYFISKIHKKQIGGFLFENFVQLFFYIQLERTGGVIEE
jgi:hypothetical protein